MSSLIMIFWESTLASVTLWGGSPITTLSFEDLSINGFGLANENICVSKLTDNPNLNLRSFDLPRIDWRGFLGHYTRWRKLDLTLTVKASWASEFRTVLEGLRQQLLKPQSTLTWKMWGEFMEIDVTAVTLPNVFNNYNIDFLTFTVSFQTLKPFWEERTYTTNAFLDTTASFSSDVNNSWNANSNPIAIFVFKTWISWTDTISVSANWKTITVNEAISDSDILEINCETKEVLLNSVAVDFTWSFFELVPGSNIVDFTLNWTFDVDLNFIHKNNFQ